MSPSKALKALVAVVFVSAGILAFASAASAQDIPEVRIRLAHLSPDTQPMDVYVAGADGVESKILSSLSFNQVSEYVTVPQGAYQFGMRPAGAPATDPAEISAYAVLTNADAYTFAALGPNAAMKTQLLTDDLTAPKAGSASVRMIQAAESLGLVDVEVVDGPGIFSSVDFGDATPYAELAPGSWKVRVQSKDASVAPVESMVEIQPGSIVTLIVGGKNQTTLAVTTVVDAAGLDMTMAGGEVATPTGGIATGGGGTAGSDDGAPVTLLLVALTGAVLIAGSATVAVRANRARS